MDKVAAPDSTLDELDAPATKPGGLNLPECVHYIGLKPDFSGHQWCDKPAAFFDHLGNAHCNEHKQAGDTCVWPGPGAGIR